MKTTINFLDFKHVKLGYINKKKVLILTKAARTYYLPVPKCLTFKLNLDSCEISCESDTYFSVYNIFKSIYTNIQNDLLFSTKQKLLLKGLGFRGNVNTDENTLLFKLGYSHTSSLKIPSFVKNIKIKKSTVLLEGTDKILLGDYIQKIFRLKKSDAYKGKGFSYKYNTRKLKIIKKK